MGAPTITIRYFAGAAAAAGRDEEPLAAPGVPTLEAVLAAVAETRPEVADVLPRCSFLWDAVAVRDPALPLPGLRGDAADSGGPSTAAAQHTLDILPPFAGG